MASIHDFCRIVVAALVLPLLTVAPAFAGTYDLTFVPMGPAMVSEGALNFHVDVTITGVTCGDTWGGVNWDVDVDTGGPLTAEPADVGTPAPAVVGFSDVGPTVGIDIAITDDAIFEGFEETFEISLTPGTGFMFSCDAGTFSPNLTDYRLLVKIIENEPTPIISVDDVFPAEDDNVTSFFVELSDPVADETVSVDIMTEDGSALAGSDYIGLNPGTISFMPGMTSIQVDVTLVDDFDAEAPEEFFLKLENPVNADLAFTPFFATGYISDDDVTTAFFAQNAEVDEGQSGQTMAEVVVTLEAPAASRGVMDPQVDYRTEPITATPGVDYQPVSGTLVFMLGETEKTISIPVEGDTTVEPDEQFKIVLENAVGAPIFEEQGIITIENDDTFPTLRVMDASVVEGDEGVTEIAFPVELLPASDNDVTFAWSTQPGSATSDDGDFNAVDEMVTIPAGSTSTTLVVEVVGDTLDEGDETFAVRIRNVNGAAIARNRADGTIIDDDAGGGGGGGGGGGSDPVFSIGDAGIPEGDAGTFDNELVVTLTPASTDTVQVDYRTLPNAGTATPGDDYLATQGTLVFAPGETRRVVVISTRGDTEVEDDETVVVGLANPDGAAIEDDEGILTILNDDDATPPGLRVDNVAVTEGDDGRTTASFTVTAVTRAARNKARISVDYRTEDGTALASDGDYEPVAGTLEFDTAQGTATIDVDVLGDTRDEDDEFFELVLSNPNGATLIQARGRALIRDDDQDTGPGPERSVVRLVAADATMEGTGPARVTIERVGGNGAARALVGTTSGTARAGEDFVDSRIAVSWAAGETGPRQVEIPVIDDRIQESTERFAVGIIEAQNAEIGTPRTLPIAITDDDTPMRLEAVGDQERTETVRDSIELAVRVVREDGGPVEGALVQWAAEGRARLPDQGRSPSDADGTATQRVVTANVPGNARIAARLVGTDATVTFVLTVEGDLRGTVGGGTNDDDSNEGGVAEALDESCANADGDANFGPLCDYVFGLANPEDQRQVVERLVPRDAIAQVRTSLRSPKNQIRNVTNRLGAVRGGAVRQASVGQLAFAVQGDPLSLGPLQDAFSSTGSQSAYAPSDDDLLAQAVDRALVGALGRGASADGIEPDGEADADNRPEIDLGGESPWGFFMNGRASFGDAPRMDRDPGYEFETQGLTTGVDYRLSDRVVLGAAVGYLRTDTDVQGGGTVDVEGYSLTGYATWYSDNWYVDAVLSYGQNSITLERVIELPQAFSGLDRLVAVGEPDSDQISAHVAFGYDTRLGAATTLTGFVRGSFVRAEVDSYVESGAFVFDLAFAEQTAESLLGEIGVEVVHPVSVSWGVLQPMVRVSYLHEFEDDPQLLIGRFARDPRARTFRIFSEQPDVDYFNVAAGLTATFPRGWAGYLQYDTDLERDDLDIYTLSGGFRFQF